MCQRVFQQAGIKFDKEAYYLALGACAKAAAARGDIDRLRKVYQLFCYPLM